MGFGKDGKGAIIREDVTLAHTTFTARTAQKLAGLSGLITKNFRMLKVEVMAHIQGLTAGEADMLAFGICNGELTNGEIAECLQPNGPRDRNDRVLTERAERYVTILAYAGPKDNDQLKCFYTGKLGERLIVHKPRWTFSEPEGWSWFVYNNGTTLTTGSLSSVVATIYGIWV